MGTGLLATYHKLEEGDDPNGPNAADWETQFEADLSGRRFRPIPLPKMNRAPRIRRQPIGSPR